MLTFFSINNICLVFFSINTIENQYEDGMAMIYFIKYGNRNWHNTEELCLLAKYRIVLY